ncbi:hypothetical protein AB0K48_18100 [Nonomuraea sp. NPDC055795]
MEKANPGWKPRSGGQQVASRSSGQARNGEGASTASKGEAELFAAVRRDARLEGMSAQALAREYGVHRRMVTQALGSP